MLIKTLIGLVLAGMAIAAIMFGGYVPCAILTVLCIACTHEMLGALKLREYKPFLIPVYLFAVSACPLMHLNPKLVLFMFSLCFIATTAELLFNEKRTVQDAITGIFTMIYPVSFISMLTMLDTACDAYVQHVALLMAFGAPSLADSFAYFGGVAFGKRKLCPRISPKKTIAGSIGSMLGGAVSGVVVFYLCKLVWSEPPANSIMPTMLTLIILGFICGIVGQIGDLFASAIKRWAGIKDFGSIFPGHGGVMDRLDSIVMCAPVVLAFFIQYN